MSHSPDRTLALDVSTRAVGWVVADDRDYLASGCFRPRSPDAYTRIEQIGAWLEQMIADWKPAQIAVEEPCGDHNNQRSDRLLGCALGVVLERARCAGARLLLVHPMRVKATGLHKKAVRMAAAYVGKARMGADEADAVGVWQASLVPAWGRRGR